MIHWNYVEYRNLVSYRIFSMIIFVSFQLFCFYCSGPLYLNRQIILLLSHRLIDDRTFLLLQNEHQKTLSESLVHPQRAYELLSEKLNRNLFPLRSLIDDGHINLIQEPFFFYQILK